MEPRVILNNQHLELIINRLCYQLVENHNDFSNTVLIGLQPRGVFLAERIVEKLKTITGVESIQLGKLDITFYRDDFRRRDLPATASETEMDFLIEDRKVVLIDDVLYTGRTIRSGLDALMDFGRPQKVELLVLVDRRFSRHLPIQPDYIGRTVDAIVSEHVEVDWSKDKGKVILKSLDSE